MSSVEAGLVELRRELNRLYGEMINTAGCIRRDFCGIGSGYCADSVEQAAQMCKTLARLLEGFSPEQPKHNARGLK